MSQSTNSSNASEYSCKFTLLLELAQVSNAKVDGVYLEPITQSPTDNIDGAIFIRKGYWKFCKLRFQIRIGLPHEKPSMHITTKGVYHPLVDPESGRVSALNISRKFAALAKVQGRIVSILSELHAIFNNPLAQSIGNAEEVLNQEAARIFQDDKKLFAQIVKDSFEKHTNPDKVSPFAVNGSDEWNDNVMNSLDQILRIGELQNQIAAGLPPSHAHAEDLVK